MRIKSSESWQFSAILHFSPRYRYRAWTHCNTCITSGPLFDFYAKHRSSLSSLVNCVRHAKNRRRHRTHDTYFTRKHNNVGPIRVLSRYNTRAHKCTICYNVYCTRRRNRIALIVSRQLRLHRFERARGYAVHNNTIFSYNTARLRRRSFHRDTPYRTAITTYTIV